MHHLASGEENRALGGSWVLTGWGRRHGALMELTELSAFPATLYGLLCKNLMNSALPTQSLWEVHSDKWLLRKLKGRNQYLLLLCSELWEGFNERDRCCFSNHAIWTSVVYTFPFSLWVLVSIFAIYILNMWGHISGQLKRWQVIHMGTTWIFFSITTFIYVL